MADLARHNMLSSLRTSRAVSGTAAAPAPTTNPSYSTVEMELQLQQMRLQNLQLQEHLLMQQAHAQAHAQQYAMQQQRWLQHHIAAGGQVHHGRGGAYYGGAGVMQDHLAQQQAQLLAMLGGQPGEEAWEENQEAAERAWMMEQLRQSAAREAAAEEEALALLPAQLQQMTPHELAQLQDVLNRQYGPSAFEELLVLAAQQQQQNEEREQRERERAEQVERTSSAASFRSNSSSTARVSNSPPPALVLSAPGESFPVFAATDEQSAETKFPGTQQTPRVTVKTKAARGDTAHRHTGSLSSTSSSEGDSSVSSAHSEVTSYESTTTAGTNLSPLDDDAKKAGVAALGLGRPNHAAGLAAALSGAGTRQSSRPTKPAALGLNPFAASFAPSAAPIAAPITAQIIAPQATPLTAIPPPTATPSPFRVQSSPANGNGVIAAIPVRTPRGPASEADLPSKNFASMARKRNLGLLGRRNPSSPTNAASFAAQQDAMLADARKASLTSLQVPGMVDAEA